MAAQRASSAAQSVRSFLASPAGASAAAVATVAVAGAGMVYLSRRARANPATNPPLTNASTLDDVIITEATESDVPLILSFIRQLADFEKLLHEVVADEEILRQTLFCPTPRAKVAFVVRAGTPVAFALYIYTASSFLGKPGIYLEDLFVQPAHRGLGIGKLLLTYLAQKATDHACGRLEWVVLDWNERAIRFYNSIGARPVDGLVINRVQRDQFRRLIDLHHPPIDNFSIRPAERGDVPIVLEFIRELAVFEKMGKVRATESDLATLLFGAVPRAFVVFACVDGAPIAFAFYTFNFSTFYGRPGVWMNDVFVRPSHRGLGVGKRLLSYLAQVAQDNQCGRVEWAVSDWNQSAIRFYKALGAAPVLGWTIYRLSGPALSTVAKADPKSLSVHRSVSSVHLSRS